ncbi:MAG TPA: DinB family protein, partial [Arenibaculum sp.]|nr:DinB family protein [Arenibaculum sp.]
MTPDHFRTFARYNTWANAHLLDAVARLAEAEIAKPRRSFFGSILNTLNHMLVADGIWLGRIDGVPSGFTALNEVPYPELPALAEARRSMDARIVALCDGLDAERLAADLVYRTLGGTEQRTPFTWVLSHQFNHQTHHR